MRQPAVQSGSTAALSCSIVTASASGATRLKVRKVMVECGWPIDVRGGDWDATALNHAVFRGDSELTDFLLARGAIWREGHGYGSDVLGTLSWASVNEPTGIGDPNWNGCARALRAHGLPRVERDPSNPERVLIDGRPMRFSESVTEVLLEGGTRPN